MSFDEKYIKVQVALTNAFLIHMNEEYKNVKIVAQLTYNHISKRNECTWEEYFPGDWERELIPFTTEYEFMEQIDYNIVHAIYVEYDYNGIHIKKFLYK